MSSIGCAQQIIAIPYWKGQIGVTKNDVFTFSYTVHALIETTFSIDTVVCVCVLF